MNKGFWKHRRYIFLLFLLSFFILAPLIVLYTAGYRYNITTGTVLRTGILSAASTPKGAAVFIDNIPAGETPLIVKTIIPGVHIIKIEAENYLPWQKNIRIESRQTAFVTPNLLKNSPRETTFASSSENILSISETSKAIYQNTETHTVSLFDLVNKKTTVLIEGSDISEETENIQIVWSLNNDIALITLFTSESKNYNLFYTDTGIPYSLPALKDAEPILSAWFETGRADSLHFLKEDGLWEYKLSTKELALIGPSSVKQSMWMGNDLFVLQNAGDFVSAGFLKGEATSILAYLPQITNGQYTIIPAPGNRILITESTQNTISLINPQNTTNPLELQTKGMLPSFEPGGDRILYTDGFEIFLYTPYGNNRETLTRISRPITQLLWHPNHDWILFGTDTELNALETFTTHGDRTSFPIAKGVLLKTIMQKDKKSLILLDHEDGINTVDLIEL